MRLFFLFLCFILLACAQEVSLQDEEKNFIYQASSSNQKNHYMTCNLLRDNTFQGYLYSSSKDNCRLLEINNSPKDLFRDDSLFVQIYPFKAAENDMSYGKELRIYIMERLNGRLLVESFVLDNYIVKVELEKEESSFFKEHKLELCGLDEQWDGIQIVVYERRSYRGDKPIPVRISKVLKPPFLIHPEYFRDVRGNNLVKYHPFFNYISELNSDPNQYYDWAKQCNRFD